MKQPVVSLSRLAALAVMSLFVVLACSGSSPGISPTPDPGGTPTPGPSAKPAPVLKYALLDQLGPLSFCDPDLYPVAIGDIATRAVERLPEIQADEATFRVILAHVGIAEAPSYEPNEITAIYFEWKVLNAIALSSIGNDRFRFDITTMADGAAEGERTAGIIDAQGSITVEQQAPSGPQVCPICLARATLIDTPDGPRAVEDLRVGDAVWTVDSAGVRNAATILRAGSMTAPASHRVVHLVLADGRELWISPGHPLLDGRTAEDARPGDVLDGALVTSAKLVSYAGGQTFDILPSGATGAYWAGGILVGSSLSSLVGD